MCGIFGILLSQEATLPARSLKKATDSAFRLSESRGKEASGIAARAGGSIYVFKEPESSSRLIRSAEYRSIFQDVQAKDGPIAIMGHSRLVTNGQSEKNSNNQPVVKDGAVGVHNGIIVNDAALWAERPSLKRLYDVDTEVLLSLLQAFRSEGRQPAEAARETYRLIDGSASIAVMFNDSDSILLATNTGSLYTCLSNDRKMLIFSSEGYSLKQLAGCPALKAFFDPYSVSHVPAGEGRIIGMRDMAVNRFSLKGEDVTALVDDVVPKKALEIIETFPQATSASASYSNGRFKLKDETKKAMMRNWERIYSGEAGIRRCTKCLMPETTPFIRYDEKGVCNFCHGYDARGGQLKGDKALEDNVAKYRSVNGDPDCIVGFSGGRDSTYGLDYLVKKLKMNPITFTYDWGMVNDLARRNQSRVCSRLGVEQIVVSADIKKKRENIRKNLEAWLKKPDLGMVPLFMAGDKQFYYYFHKIRQQTGVRLFVFCGGHEIEETAFKYGFCGVPHGVDNVMNKLTGISIRNKLKLLSYYAKQYLTNPSYVNRSMLDTFFAFYATYILKDDYLYLYHFIEWDEKRIIDSIKEKYEWEMAPDTIATWRIDDGTAPFYNYIYLTMAGFTEFDNFRSYQIREGKLTREEALELVKEENKPRFDAIEWYAEAVDFDVNRAVGIINAAPKRYKVNA